MDKRHVNPQTARMTSPLQSEIESLLTRTFAPTRLEVINDSAKHHGHAGDDGSGESHFTVVIESAAFTRKSRLERQRMVNRALGDIPGNRVHALAIRAFAPGDGA
jgi:BolA protein